MERLRECAILTLKNKTVAEINKILLDSCEGEQMEYRSVDSVIQCDDAVQ